MSVRHTVQSGNQRRIIDHSSNLPKGSAMDSIRELIVLAIDALGRLLTTGNVSLVDLLAIGQFAVLIFLVAWVASLLTKLKLVLGGLLAVSFLSTMGLVVVGQFV